MSQPKKERYGYFYVSSFYDDLGSVQSSPYKVVRVYLSQTPLPRFSLVYILSFFAGVALSAFEVRPGGSSLVGIAVVALTGLAGKWALNLTDEIVDLESDRIAHPERPIASGTVATRDVKVVVVSLLLFVLAINLAHDPVGALVLCALLALDAAILTLAGRLSVPALNELLIPLTWASLPIYAFSALNLTEIPLGLSVSLFLYLVDLAQDIPGGIQDSEGDRKQGTRTITLAVGERRAAVLAIVSLLASNLPLALFFHERGFPTWTWALQGATFACCLAPFVRLLRQRGERECRVARAVGFHYIAVTFILIGATVLSRSS